MRKTGLEKVAYQATKEASDNAKKLGIPLVFIEGEYLIELHSDGSKKVLKHIPKHNIKLPAKFKLK